MSGLELTFGEQKTLVEGDRITDGDAVSVEQCLVLAYTDIWNAAKWSFKRVSRETFYTTADGASTGSASATPKMPDAFAEAYVLVDDQGCEVEQLSELEFERYYTDATTGVVSGRPEVFTVTNRQVMLYPQPDSAYQFRLSYRRRLATRDGSGNVQAGWYQNDGDLPLWDDHHQILVVRAKIHGLKNLTDPTASVLEDEYGRLLAAMQEDYVDRPPAGFQTPRWP